MQTVLAALAQAADEKRAGERRRVLQLFFSGRPRETVVGPLTVLGSGEVSPARFSAFRVSGGRRQYLFALALERRVQADLDAQGLGDGAALLRGLGRLAEAVVVEAGHARAGRQLDELDRPALALLVEASPWRRC